jgi:hypothetical protein
MVKALNAKSAEECGDFPTENPVALRAEYRDLSTLSRNGGVGRRRLFYL